MKKKFLAMLIVALTVLCCAFGFAACQNGETVAGTYKLYCMALNDGVQKLGEYCNIVDEDGNRLILSEEYAIFEIKEDGEFDFTMTNGVKTQTESGTYTNENSVLSLTANSQTVPAYISGNFLIFQFGSDTSWLIFRKSGATDELGDAFEILAFIDRIVGEKK